MSEFQKQSIDGGKANVDALPYIDTEYEEPGMKDLVTHLISAETSNYRPTNTNYLSHIPLDLESFNTPAITHHHNLLAGNTAQPEVLSMRRYELPPPPPGKLTDLSAWAECVDNSHAQLSHQETRIMNLELMLEYGAEGWKSYLEVMGKMVEIKAKEAAALKKKIQETNWERKAAQGKTGEELKLLESSWVGLVSKNYEIERACLDLERQIEDMKVEMARRAAMDVQVDEN